MKNTITEQAKNINTKLISHRRNIHENAETGFETIKTGKYIYETLSALGIECSFFCQNMVMGEIKGKGSGKTILLRADIDALPIEENTAVGFSCKNGNMHACGHDMHAAMLIGALEILQGQRENLTGNIRFLFQSAEEILSGAKCAVENGILDGVDMAMTLHVMTASEMPTGSAILSYDEPCAPSADFFGIKISGKGCHGSSPSIGIDPISCACRIVTALEHIKTHEIGIHNRAVLTIGEIHGGDSSNAIPEKVKMKGTIRCFEEETRIFFKKRFEEISDGIAKAFRCGCEIEYTSSCPALVNDKELLNKTAQNLEELLGKENVFKIKNTRSRIQGSEDFAYISTKVPSVSVAIPAGNTKDGYTFPLHNPNVIFDENALSVGCGVFAYNALCLLQQKNQ